MTEHYQRRSRGNRAGAGGDAHPPFTGIRCSHPFARTRIHATILPMTVAETFFHVHGMPSDVLPELCRRFHVRRLDLFGSAATGQNFDPVRSDLDLLVSF